MPSALYCDGTVSVSLEGAPLCSSNWTLVPVAEPFVINEQVISDFALAFGIGFSLVATCFLAGWGFRTVLSLIR